MSESGTSQHVKDIHEVPDQNEDAPKGTGGDPVKVPGDKLTITSKAANVGMGALAGFAPLSKICQHVCAFHCYAHDMTRQVRAHHYCSHLNEEVRQCVLYDSPAADAKLIGIEYIISRRLYEQLPAEEQSFWHSHAYEVTSGMLYCPNVPVAAENIEMEKVINTYGKTIHTWQVDRGDPLPFGPPQLMMAFIADGQLKQELVDKRDAEMGKNTAELREKRAHIKPDPPVPHPAADHPHHTGMALQTVMQPTPFIRSSTPVT